MMPLLISDSFIFCNKFICSFGCPTTQTTSERILLTPDQQIHLLYLKVLFFIYHLTTSDIWNKCWVDIKKKKKRHCWRWFKLARRVKTSSKAPWVITAVCCILAYLCHTPHHFEKISNMTKYRKPHLERTEKCSANILLSAHRLCSISTLTPPGLVTG